MKMVYTRDLKSLGETLAGSIPAERTNRHYLDGKPYYCIMCNLGYYEYMACEEIYCKLESDLKRQRENMRGNNDP